MAKRAPLRITWTSSEKLAMMMALLGFSSHFIAKRTSLTESQIAYRIRRLNLAGCRAAFRNGETPLANRTISLSEHIAMPMVERQLQTPKPQPLRRRKAA